MSREGRKSFLFGNRFLKFLIYFLTEKYNIMIDLYNKNASVFVDLL